jgi:hypothetical protein
MVPVFVVVDKVLEHVAEGRRLRLRLGVVLTHLPGLFR